MKKVTAILLVLAMVMMMLSGCGSKNAESGDEMFKVGIIQLMEHPSLDTIRESII